MSAFKVGQRVKKICNRAPEHVRPHCSPMGAALGATGTVMPRDPGDLDDEIPVLWDGFRSRHSTGQFQVMPYMLAPLTDPAAEAFIESLKKIKPYEEPRIAFAVHLDKLREAEERAGETE